MSSDNHFSKRYKIHINGMVQGIGFRPFVYSLAASLNLNGYVLNASDGVNIEIEGKKTQEFIQRLKLHPLAKIDNIIIEEAPRNLIYNRFEIKESLPVASSFSLVQPDIAVCPDCLEELFNENNRRYLYPFINCTNCGPRYSIILNIPYDRQNTTMSCFEMCDECRAEYNNPSNRRFHAQPNACPECGPKIQLQVASCNLQINEKEPVKAAIDLLKQGGIVAIKGIGGFHLACDAKNDAAVKKLRNGKQRSSKPFAVMMPDIETIKQYCEISHDEKNVLSSLIKPIVLLKKKNDIAISDFVAYENNYLGVMLPYAPLHFLLFRHPSTQNFDALVMTSGNISEEPIAADNEDAVKKLSDIADAFLMHNRDIYMRVDDSVASKKQSQFTIIRRSRGFAPEPIDIGEEMPEILACGGQLKNTFCITKGRYAIISQHIGDMENKETIEFYKETLKNLKNTFDAKPSIIAHDMHPNYWTTEFAKKYHSQLAACGLRLIAVQHHHAHIVSCMAEHGLKEDVIGIVFDGAGYGIDGNIWGGEILIADRKGFTRFAHLDYVPMPGSEMAIKEPWRMAASYLINTYGDNAKDVLPLFFDRFKTTDIGAIIMMMKKKINSPLTSSCGRLFDAVSSFIGIKDIITFEGEAAIKLEMLADEGCYERYGFSISDKNPATVDIRQTIKEIVDDIKANVPPSIISARFHNTIAEIALYAAIKIRDMHGIEKVVLSGGVFQNSFLVEKIKEKFASADFKIFFNEKIPANDGGISLGQAVIAAELCSTRISL